MRFGDDIGACLCINRMPFREAIWVSGFCMNAIGQFAYFCSIAFLNLYAMRSFRFDWSAWADVVFH